MGNVKQSESESHMPVTLPSVQVMPSQPEHGSVVGSQLVSTVPLVSMLACDYAEQLLVSSIRKRGIRRWQTPSGALLMHRPLSPCNHSAGTATAAIRSMRRVAGAFQPPLKPDPAPRLTG